MSNRGNSQQRGSGRGGGTGGGPRGSDAGRGGRGRASPASSERASDVGFPRGIARGRGHSGGLEGRGRGAPGVGGGTTATRGFGGGPAQGVRGGGPSQIVFASDIPAHVDGRIASSDQLVAAFKKLSVRSELPLRPGFGKLGKPITLRANFFPVKVPKGIIIYDYKVDITPKTDINRLKARIFHLLEEHPQFSSHVSYVAHDRSERLVSAKKLPEPFDIPVTFYEDGQTPGKDSKVYNVSITFTGALDTNNLAQYLEGQVDSRDHDPLPLISALNLVLQQYPANMGVRVGKNRWFLPSSAEKQQLSLGVEAWKGFFTSVRPVYKQLMVNVNVCMTAFYVPGNLAEAIMAFSQVSRGGMPQKFAQGFKVTTHHLGYKTKKPLKKIMSTTARTTKFDCAELGGQVTVEQYFKRKYNITLQHAHDLPVVNIGGRDKDNFVPAELCEIEAGQPYRGKLNDKETASMIKIACNRPAVNATAIVRQGLPALGYSPTVSAPVDGFGISISTEMAVIPARELPPPKLSYRDGTPNVRDGSWNILDVTFHRGSAVQSWWTLVVRDGRDEFNGTSDPRLLGLLQGLRNKCAKSGMTMPNGPPTILVTPPLVPPSQDSTRASAVDQIREVFKKNLASSRQKPSFILVLLSGRDNYIYPGIKRLGDVEFGVHTVHMLLSKALGEPRKQDQYLSNVTLKINTKLGGINHKLDAVDMKWLTTKKTMIVGMDVTHPSPTSRLGSPSIAAVVASVDDAFVQFPGSIRIQKGKKEMITELTAMMVERLRLYEKKNKALPERIFIFRDGVSEGQFQTVLEDELVQTLESFKKFNTKGRTGPFRPKLTICVCGKRHHARFYPTTAASADRNGNTRPGTVVDKGITAIYEFDFYLQAHAGLQGTVRPTHYTVVYDENNLSADEIQQGTHTASYLYGRATKAVSLIPCAYFSDLACERGRCYINDFLNVEDDKESTRGSMSGKGKGKGEGKGKERDVKAEREEEQEKVFNAAKAKWGEGLHPDLRDSMFYI